MNKILITICARGGSKGIPNKNIKILNGKPLIAYSIEIAQKFAKQHNADIGLSTDSTQILKVAEQFRLKSDYLRPKDLAKDDVGKIEVIKDLLNYYEKKRGYTYDYILDLDVTSPLRTIEDLNQAFTMLQKNEEALNIFSVSKARKNPYFNMVEQNQNGFYDLVKKGEYFTRQSAPKVYELNASFYFYRRIFFEQNNPIAITNKSLIYLMDHICFDVDDSVDFLFLKYLVENKLLDFEI